MLTENKIEKTPSILCMGVGWFPTHPGGLERYMYELIQRLAANNDRIELCGVGLPEAEVNSPIKLTNLAAPDTQILQRLWSCRRNFSKTSIDKVDAVNLHFALYSLPILDLLPKDIPITFNFHGPWALESQQEGVKKLGQNLKHFVESKVYQRCDRFIVLSSAFGNILHQQYQIPRSKIHIIPGGVDIESFQPNLSPQLAREHLGFPLHRPILFTSRRLVHRMGISQLLQAVAAIKPKIPDIWLAIAGRGPLLETLQQQATEWGLSDNVKFLGFLAESDLPIAYQAADLTVMPSQSLEGFGLAVVESLACGTPVLCTPVGGMPEILQPFSPDLITSSTQVSDIAERLLAVLLEKIPKPDRSACRKYAVDRYDWNKIALLVREVILDENFLSRSKR